MTDMVTLFARDPRRLTKQDIRTIVEELRSMRVKFKAGNKTAGTTQPKLTAKEAEVKKLGIDLDIKL